MIGGGSKRIEIKHGKRIIEIKTAKITTNENRDSQSKTSLDIQYPGMSRAKRKVKQEPGLHTELLQRVSRTAASGVDKPTGPEQMMLLNFLFSSPIKNKQLSQQRTGLDFAHQSAKPNTSDGGKLGENAGILKKYPQKMSMKIQFLHRISFMSHSNVVSADSFSIPFSSDRPVGRPALGGR